MLIVSLFFNVFLSDLLFLCTEMHQKFISIPFLIRQPQPTYLKILESDGN